MLSNHPPFQYLPQRGCPPWFSGMVWYFAAAKKELQRLGFDSQCHPHIMAGRRVEEGGKGRRCARRGQGSPQLTRTGGESPLVSGWWRKNWIKTCCHIPDRMYAKMIQIKKNIYLKTAAEPTSTNSLSLTGMTLIRHSEAFEKRRFGFGK